MRQVKGDRLRSPATCPSIRTMLQLKDYVADWPDIDYSNFRAGLDAAE
jgi:hypothetical protein